MSDEAAENPQLTELKLSFEKAAKEIKEWLDFKQISDVKRAEAEHNIGRLMFAMAQGRIVMDPVTKKITQTLKFPVGTEAVVKELVFKPRITVGEIQPRLAEVGPNDNVGRVLAYVGAATGEISAVIQKLDSEDYHLSGDIVFFFMITA